MCSSRSPLVELLAALREGLGALGARWYLFGAQAAIVHGATRLTADVDVDLATRSTADLVVALGTAGFDLRVPDAEALGESTRVMPFVHGPTRIPVDVVLAGPGLEDLFFAQAEERAISGVPVPVASADDVVTMKVLAGRPKDLEDSAAVVRAQGPRFDVQRARTTLGLLETALDRRDLVPELDKLLARAVSESTPRGRPGPSSGP